MRQDLRRFRSALLLILAFSLGLGAQLLQAQVSVTPGRYRFGATIAPAVNDGAALGTTALGWSDLHLATGGVINWANGEVTITETDANTLTLAGGVLSIPNGTIGAVSLAFPTVSGEQHGIFSYAADAGAGAAGIAFQTVGTQALFISGATIQTHTGHSFSWGTGNSGTTARDTELFRESPAIIQQGPDAAAPVAQTFKGPDARAGTDTDTVGGDITFAAGRSTGTGNPGSIFFQTGATNSPGTAAGPLTTRLQIASSGTTIIASHTRFNVASSTTGTNTPVFSGNAPIGQTAPYVWVAAIASDGTAVWIPAWR